MEYIESIVKEVKEERSHKGTVASACKEFTNQHSTICWQHEFTNQLRFGPEWVVKKQGPKDIPGFEELWALRPAPTEGWTKLDWNVYIVALEIEVRRRNAPQMH